MNRRVHIRSLRFALKPLAAALASAGIAGAALAGPQDGVVRAGTASISTSGAQTRIQQSSDRAVIDWRSFGIGAAEQVLFQQPSARSATLNRVTGGQVSALHGRLDANGQVLLVNPNGIVIGAGAQINVGSFIASTSNISNANFMAGRLVFDQPGNPGAGIANSGSITAAEGGLVALVAPHVRNDGWIQARLGKVVLGGADTFTLDLYGDELISLALSDANVSGSIRQSGTIDAGGGRAMLVTAADAKNVLDNVINMSGTIKADSAVAQGGTILLLPGGGKVEVSGTLSADGATGGGTIHVGGGFQGAGTHRASSTIVNSGATLKANATGRGDGGEVVVWSDGNTTFAGDIQAKGGPVGGNGGRMEVSGKGTLAFLGTADASAPLGAAGSLLLDPAILDIGLAEAGLISRVLRTGTSTSLQADVDINVNSLIDGRGMLAGGGLTMTAGNNVNINDFVLTNNGAINLFATGGTVNVASGKAVFAGMAPITVRTGGTLHTGSFLTGGMLSLTSTAGAVAVDTFIDAFTGRVDINAATDADINQPIVSMASGNPLNVTAGNDINVNAQVDGRGGVAGGGVTLDAGRNINAAAHLVTNNAALSLTARTGTVVTSAGKGAYAGSGPIAVTSGGTLTTGILSTTGTITVQSTAGSLNVNAPIDAAVGALSLIANAAVNLNEALANPRSDAPLTVTAGTDINVNSPIDVRGASPQNPSGVVTLNAGQNVNLNQNVVTNNAAINVKATTGTLVTAASKGLYAGSAPISVTAGATLNTGITSTTRSLSLASTGGSVNVNAPIPDTTGSVTISAGGTVNVNQPITNIKTGNPLVINAGNDLNLNAPIDGRSGAAAGGAVSLAAVNNLRLFDDIVTNDGPITLKTTVGSVFLAPVLQDANLLILVAPKQVRAGNAPITIVSGGDFSTGAPPPQPLPDPSTLNPPVNVTDTDSAKVYQRDFLKQYVQLVTTGPLNITSTNGSVNVIAPIPDTTGPVTINAGNAINVKHKVNSDQQPIILNGGTGGITIFAVNDKCAGTILCDQTAPVDARLANLTLNSFGDVSITSEGVATAKTLTIDTRARILTGSIGVTSDTLSRPATVVLIADQGIQYFNVGKAGDVSATSIGGSITLDVFLPKTLRITTGTPDPNNPTAATDCTTCNINTGGWMGPDVVLNAGGSINLLPTRFTDALTLIARAADVNLRQTLVDKILTISAGRDVKFNASGCSTIDIGVYCGLVWVGPNPTASATSGPLSITAGRDVLTDGFSPIHVSNGQSLSLIAGRNATLNLIETLGPVSITASTGSITANNPIGPSITNGGTDPDFNPSDLGVASLTMSAPAGSITMTGARAQGNIVISTGGNLASSRQIVSVSGSVSLTAPNQALNQAVPIGSQNQLLYPGTFLGVVSPGPSVPAPDAPNVTTVGASAAGGLAEISVTASPLFTAGGSATVPAGGTSEEAVDTAAAQRAAQQAAATDQSAQTDTTLVALADSVGEPTVLCPAGVAPGTTVKAKDASGNVVTAKCK